MSYDRSTTYVRGFKHSLSDSYYMYISRICIAKEKCYAELIVNSKREFIKVHRAMPFLDNEWLIRYWKNGIHEIRLYNEPFQKITDAQLCIKSRDGSGHAQLNYVTLKNAIKVLKDFDICDLKNPQHDLLIVGYIEGCELQTPWITELKMHEDGLFHAITDRGREYIISSWSER